VSVGEENDQKEKRAREAANRQDHEDRKKEDRGAFGSGSPAP